MFIIYRNMTYRTVVDKIILIVLLVALYILLVIINLKNAYTSQHTLYSIKFS